MADTPPRLLTRKTILVAVVVAALAAGGAAAWLHERAAAGREWVQAVERSRELADRAFSAYRAGSDDEAVAALRRYLSYLEGSSPATDPWRPPSHPQLDARGLALDRTLTAGRLALVESRRGNADAAALAWARAERAAEAAGLDEAIEAFEVLAARLVRLGSRAEAAYEALVHPVHAAGRVFGWEIMPLEAVWSRRGPARDEAAAADAATLGRRVTREPR